MISPVFSEPYDGVNVIKSLKRLGELRAGGAGAMIHSGAGEKTKRAALSGHSRTSGLWRGTAGAVAAPEHCAGSHTGRIVLISLK